jgi:hypothetical protein
MFTVFTLTNYPHGAESFIRRTQLFICTRSSKNFMEPEPSLMCSQIPPCSILCANLNQSIQFVSSISSPINFFRFPNGLFSCVSPKRCRQWYYFPCMLYTIPVPPPPRYTYVYGDRSFVSAGEYGHIHTDSGLCGFRTQPNISIY